MTSRQDRDASSGDVRAVHGQCADHKEQRSPTPDEDSVENLAERMLERITITATTDHRESSWAVLGTISPAKIGYRAEHCFSMVLIEVMVKATEAAPVLVEELELVLSDGDSFPVTSTCCPR